MPPYQEILIQILRALAPEVLAVVKEQFNRTGLLPTSDELDAAIVAKRDQKIAEGDDWLDKHRDS
jgi:hypothetical protein